ncbi:hypothetical protein [Marinimicrobium sp. C2-29]|uniref:hypothetical protein n=1 Tax=Marinimicrobium sp. C2-29 TaxID=3139825 RepID=UPI0031390251
MTGSLAATLEEDMDDALEDMLDVSLDDTLDVSLEEDMDELDETLELLLEPGDSGSSDPLLPQETIIVLTSIRAASFVGKTLENRRI